jgi:hypothetical protein
MRTAYYNARSGKMTDESNKSVGIPVVGKPIEKRWKPLQETPAEITKDEIAYSITIELYLYTYNAHNGVDYV